MSHPQPQMRIPVGVVVERRKAKSAWIDHIWRPVSILVGEAETAPWTVLDKSEETTLFYAGAAEIGLYRSDTASYRDNLAGNAPVVWVMLRPTGDDQPYEIATVTASPAEGSAAWHAANQEFIVTRAYNLEPAREPDKLPSPAQA